MDKHTPTDPWYVYSVRNAKGRMRYFVVHAERDADGSRRFVIDADTDKPAVYKRRADAADTALLFNKSDAARATGAQHG